MTTFTEGPHDCAFILSEAAGSRSRENGTLITGQNLEAGAVLAASGAKLTEFVSGTAVGILLYKTDATDADVRVSYLARDAEVNLKLLSIEESTDGGEREAAATALLPLGIICRDEGADAAVA